MDHLPGPSNPAPPGSPAGAVTGVRVASAFFLLGGVLEVAMHLHDAPRPLAFWPAWEALGRGLLHALLAWGLWHRLAFCRSLAIVYCFAVLILYTVVLGLALAHAPLQFPPAVVVQSLYELPSCALLLPWLRSPRAAAAFPRHLLRRSPAGGPPGPP